MNLITKFWEGNDQLNNGGVPHIKWNARRLSSFLTLVLPCPITYAAWCVSVDSSLVFGGQFLGTQESVGAYRGPESVVDTFGRQCFERGRAKGGEGEEGKWWRTWTSFCFFFKCEELEGRFEFLFHCVCAIELRESWRKFILSMSNKL